MSPRYKPQLNKQFATVKEIMGVKVFWLSLLGVTIGIVGFCSGYEEDERGLGRQSIVPTRVPCECAEGQCGCCAQFFSRQKACVNITYIPEDFEFHYKLHYNDRLLYQNKISGKNPRPVCLPISRWIRARVCLQLSNVYMLGRNLHACVDLQGEWLDFELFEVSFDCFRIGVNGVAVIKPEEGGGIPAPSLGSGSSQEDYDDSAR